MIFGFLITVWLYGSDIFNNVRGRDIIIYIFLTGSTNIFRNVEIISPICRYHGQVTTWRGERESKRERRREKKTSIHIIGLH